MALTVKNFELPDGTILQDAYLRVQSIKTENRDYEFFEKVYDNPDVDEKLSWINRIETEVTVFVWADEVARKNRAYVVNWFKFNIDYNLSEWQNIYEQAYHKLKQIYPEGVDN